LSKETTNDSWKSSFPIRLIKGEFGAGKTLIFFWILPLLILSFATNQLTPAQIQWFKSYEALLSTFLMMYGMLVWTGITAGLIKTFKEPDTRRFLCGFFIFISGIALLTFALGFLAICYNSIFL
jgi:hypothetical protein